MPLEPVIRGDGRLRLGRLMPRQDVLVRARLDAGLLGLLVDGRLFPGYARRPDPRNFLRNAIPLDPRQRHARLERFIIVVEHVDGVVVDAGDFRREALRRAGDAHVYRRAERRRLPGYNLLLGHELIVARAVAAVPARVGAVGAPAFGSAFRRSRLGRT